MQLTFCSTGKMMCHWEIVLHTFVLHQFVLCTFILQHFVLHTFVLHQCPVHICPTPVCPTHINLSYTNLPNDSISTCLKKRVNIITTGVEITYYFVINSEQQLHDLEF